MVFLLRKYYIADILSTLEVLCAVVLVIVSLLAFPPEWALLTFCAGELLDAFDGPCARKWPYPEDQKKHWWKNSDGTSSALDMLGDLFLGLALLLYVILNVNTLFGLVTLGICLVIAVPIQLYRNNRLMYAKNYALQYELCSDENSGKSQYKEKAALYENKATRAVLFRRFLYILGISVMIVILLVKTSWPQWLKIMLLVFGGMIGIILWFLKRDRRTQDKTGKDGKAKTVFEKSR